MATLLRIDSSPLGDGASFSRHLTSEFVEKWKATHPGGVVISRDVTTTKLSPIDGEWIGAAYTPKASRTPRQREVLALSDELIAELKAADEFVIGVPMHNFSIPGGLKLWIDQVARVGETFSYEKQPFSRSNAWSVLRKRSLQILCPSAASACASCDQQPFCGGARRERGPILCPRVVLSVLFWS